MDNQQVSFQRARRFSKVLGGISLVIAPLLSLIGWGISHDSFGSFIRLWDFYHAQNGAFQLSATSAPAIVFRFYLLPHYFIYASMPIYIAMALTIMRLTFIKSPWFALIGAILSIIGAVYFIGVLGAYLSTPIGSVIMTDILKISFALCILVFVGNILLGISLYKTKISAKWTSLLFIIGNAFILIFPGIENWMTLGSFLMLIAMFPLTKMLVKDVLLQPNP